MELCVRSESLRPEQALSLQLLRDVQARNPDSDIFVGGSIFAGLGTPASDIDVYVLAGSGGETEQLQEGTLRVDVEYLAADIFANLARAVDESTGANADAARMYAASTGHLDLLGRFESGRILQDPAGKLTEARTVLSTRRDSIADVRITHYARGVANLFEDSRGFTAVGESAADYFTTLNALTLSGKAYLLSLGAWYPGLKWVWQQWRSIVDEDRRFAPDLLEQSSKAGGTSARWLAQDLLVQALTRQAYSARPHLAESTAYAKDTLVRDQHAAPLRHENAFGVLRPDLFSVKLSSQGLALWGYAHGRDYGSAVRGFSETFGTGETAVARYLDRLIESELLSIGSPR